MPSVALPVGSEDALEPVAILGNLATAGILRYLRQNPGATSRSICDALELKPPTVQLKLEQLEAAHMISGDPRLGEARRGVWVTYRVNEEAVTDLYLRLGLAIGEF